MKSLFLLLCAACVSAAGPVGIQQSEFKLGAGSVPAGWTTWAPRPEIAPRTFVDMIHNRAKPGSLAISGNGNPAEFGGWEYAVQGIEPGKWYRFVAYYRAEGVRYEPLQVLAWLDWATAMGKRAGQPDYVYWMEPDGDWTKVSLDAAAPEKAAAVKLQLFLANAPQATVWWDEVSLDEIPTPAPRKVTVAAVNFRPQRSPSAAESIRRFLEVVDRTVPENADIIILPEGITIVGTGKKYGDVAEPVPGPTTKMLGEAAKRRRAYIVAGIYEREGTAIYNTAVLIDRSGNVIGKYRKVYLPREEYEGGLTPGMDYPVFQTDFGKIGMMICWDVQYADPARALALRGAELLLMPIWGGNKTLGKARAIENHVFLASSGYDYPTYIMDPDGETLASATDPGTAAVATIDLNRRYVDKWLGNMRARFMKELRLDLKVERDAAYIVGGHD
jgi:predicted amidohydrolase